MIRLLSWEWSFYLQVLATVPVWLILLMTPQEYLEVNSDAGSELTDAEKATAQ